MFTPEIITCINKSVLCWLATSSRENIPNVSPKEIFVPVGKDLLLIANIASPQSVANIEENENVCVSLVDIFVQKGFQLKGKARIIRSSDTEYTIKAKPLQEMTGEKFRIISIIEILITSVKPIVAPSYMLFPETREADQIAGALKAYKVNDLIQAHKI